MAVSRRQFLKLAGASAVGTVVFTACQSYERELLVQSPVRLPEDLVSGTDNRYATVCRECPAGCGTLVRVMEGRAKKIEGNADYPVNRGKTCARGQAAVQAVYHPDRIRNPMRRDRATNVWQDITWDEALNQIVSRLAQLRQRGQADTVLMATEPLRGHLGLVVQRFAEAYGAQHLAYETLEQTVLRTAVKEIFGQDLLPEFDIEQSEFILSFGADFLSTWLSPVRYSRAYGEFRQGRTPRGTLVQVDPRFSVEATNADEWVAVKPGQEGVLALSMAYVIVNERLGDVNASQVFTKGQGAAALVSFKPSPQVADTTGVPEERIVELARNFAGHKPRSLALAGGSAAAHTNGLFNLEAILALNYLVGSVGQPGGVLFNPAPPIAGLPASSTAASFGQWEGTLQRMRSGQPKPINALLVRGANPAYGLSSLKAQEAISKVPFIVSFSGFLDETTALADLVLPDRAPLESWGDDLPEPGPGHWTIGFQQPVVNQVPEFNSRAFGDVLLVLAEDLGGGMEKELPWNTFKDVLRDGARKLFQLNRGSVRAPTFEAFWNALLSGGGWWDEQAISRTPVPSAPVAPGAQTPDFAGLPQQFPWHLIPFASLSLNDGRGAHVPWLQATPDPVTTLTWTTWVELNAKEARDMGIKEGDILSVESPNGDFEAPAYPHPGMPPGVVAIPFGQGHTEYGQYASNRGQNVLSILTPIKETRTGAWAWAATRVRIGKTGKSIRRLPKMEGAVSPVVQLEEKPVVQVTKE